LTCIFSLTALSFPPFSGVQARVHKPSSAQKNQNSLGERPIDIHDIYLSARRLATTTTPEWRIATGRQDVTNRMWCGGLALCHASCICWGGTRSNSDHHSSFPSSRPPPSPQYKHSPPHTLTQTPPHSNTTTHKCTYTSPPTTPLQSNHGSFRRQEPPAPGHLVHVHGNLYRGTFFRAPWEGYIEV